MNCLRTASSKGRFGTSVLLDGDQITPGQEDAMTIVRVRDLGLPEGVFYGVVTLSDGEKVVYEIKGAGNRAEALKAVQEYATNDKSLGVLADGRSPVADVQLTT
jgi:hypothetical protein